MPNWVYNTVTVEGEEMPLSLFKQRVGNPYQTLQAVFPTEGPVHFVEAEVKEVFSFWNIIKPSKEETNQYHTEVEGLPFWWRWNVDNWGTKWDACYASLEEEETNLLQYRFDTAWSAPLPVIEQASKQYKDLTFRIHYIEEQDWGGEVTFNNGQVTSKKFWDTPDSHEGYVTIGYPCSCDGLDEKVFDDCPVES